MLVFILKFPYLRGGKLHFPTSSIYTFYLNLFCLVLMRTLIWARRGKGEIRPIVIKRHFLQIRGKDMFLVPILKRFHAENKYRGVGVAIFLRNCLHCPRTIDTREYSWGSRTGLREASLLLKCFSVSEPSESSLSDLEHFYCYLWRYKTYNLPLWL